MDLLKTRLENCFYSVATGYIFITSNSELLSASVSTIQSLSTSLGRRFSLEELSYCSLIAPNLINLEVSGTIKLAMPNKKRKKRKLDKTTQMVQELADLFKYSLHEYIKKHGEETLSVLRSGVQLLEPPHLVTKMTIPELVYELKTTNEYQQRIPKGSIITLGAREALYSSEGGLELPRCIKTYMESKGLQNLFSHQISAFKEIQAGNHVTISTSTSSGKSLVYQLAILKAIYEDPKTTALLIFPTKALSQDQKFRFEQFALGCGIDCRIETFDGDTPFQSRESIRTSSNIIITNPDMLHVSILPNHHKWKEFLKNIKFVMMDEIHYYSGQFGAHVTHVLMRLSRICKHYSALFQFIGCSATISDAKSHSKVLFGVDNVVIVNDDGSPTGSKHYVIWNLPFRNSKNIHPISVFEEAAKATLLLVRNEIRTIIFATSRKQCEMVFREIQELLSGDEELKRKVMAYRGGYAISDRRSVEAKLFKGELLAVVATNALELGVDIGTLDAVIHVGFPSSMSSFIQQSGRVGRRGNESLDILIVDPNSPIDLHYSKHPSELLHSPQNSIVNIDTLDQSILVIHVSCAAYELPVLEGEDILFGDTLYDNACHECLRFDKVKNAYIPMENYNNRPSASNPIRIIDENSFDLIDGTRGVTIEEIPLSKVPFTLYQSI
jgi:DEAD/DEAH box helicase domain-containing protein